MLKQGFFNTRKGSHPPKKAIFLVKVGGRQNDDRLMFSNVSVYLGVLYLYTLCNTWSSFTKRTLRAKAAGVLWMLLALSLLLAGL